MGQIRGHIFNRPISDQLSKSSGIKTKTKHIERRWQKELRVQNYFGLVNHESENIKSSESSLMKYSVVKEKMCCKFIQVLAVVI